MEDNKNVSNKNNLKEQEIDLVELARKIWDNKRLIFKSCGWAALAGLLVGFSIPKEYTTKVTLAPESSISGKSMSGGLSALASMAGINIGDTQNADALSPTLYPDIVKSIPFAVEMLDVKVSSIDDKLNTTVYEYLDKHQKSPWWSYVMSAPPTAIRWVMKTIDGDSDKDEEKKDINPFRLTMEQSVIISTLSDRIKVEENKKTSVIEISVTMQDPLISATLTDTVMVKLQQYITNYRTNKARKDLEFSEKLYNEAMEKYHRLQQEYAEYMDKNQAITMNRAKTQLERLQNETSLAFNVFNQTSQQLQVAKAKVQEHTPVYTVVEAPTVPLRAAKPSKPLILIGFVFMAAVGSCGWILFGKDLKDALK